MNNNVVIDWKKYVDHIFVIHKINKDRYHDLIKTLEYADILNSGICDFIYDFDNINANLPKDGYLKLSYNHYLVYKYCKLFNYKRVLLLEDDIRILKDKEKVINYLENLPDDFSYCLLDYQIPVQEISNIHNLYDLNIDKQYICFDKHLLYSTAAMIIDNNVCDDIIKYYEDNLINDKYINLLDITIFNRIKYNKYFCKENIFVQYEYTSNKISNFDTKQNYITRNKLDLNNYYMYE